MAETICRKVNYYSKSAFAGYFPRTYLSQRRSNEAIVEDGDEKFVEDSGRSTIICSKGQFLPHFTEEGDPQMATFIEVPMATQALSTVRAMPQILRIPY
jgi:hypothetical protein